MDTQDRDPLLATDRTLAALLPRTWSAFFGRFGRLTDVQRATIRPLLAGEDCLICAPTAGGKTEAACAPLVERYMQPGRKWTVLYVSPTRALVNDLFERIGPSLAQLSLTIGRRTGEHRDNVQAQPHVLITTPESFDSMLCRGRTDGGHILAGVRAIVLDEIHLLHGSGRGEQIRWLLERHRRLRRYAVSQGWTSGGDPQVVGLSATLPNPERVRDAYLPGGRVLPVTGGRGIEVIARPPAASTASEDAIPAYLAALDTPEKLLVFCNTRERTDELTSELRDRLEGTSYAVAGHHGSLAQKERERTEAMMRSERAIVVVATSTLEIGIDIGDVDVVALDAPPPDVPAFLQRIGRGNRRSGRTRVLLCASTPADQLQQKAMLDAAIGGRLGLPERGPHYAVAVQQVASFILQGAETTRSRSLVEEYLRSCWSAASCAPNALLDHLLEAGEILAHGSRIRLGEKWLEKASRGEIHGNIEAPMGMQVVDQATGDQIALGVKFTGGRKMDIAGRRLRVMKVGTHQIEVRRGQREGDDPARWTFAKAPFLAGAGRAAALRDYLRIPPDVWPVIETPVGFLAFHFGGATTKAVIELAARPHGVVSKANGWFLPLPDPQKPDWLQSLSVPLLDVAIEAEVDRLERTLGRPKANATLPLAVRAEEVREWLDLQAQAARIAAARVEMARADTAAHLHTLLAGLQ